ncbi:MAG: hypothetical protein DRG24_08325 [Epsilonproteobacteria bacterium]|nr:MAG: hypothetical protein DRG24_08325 [Campylobacterota bacterium]
MLILPDSQWLSYIRSISLALRSVLFEQFAVSVKILWGTFVLFWVLIGAVISFWLALAIAFTGVVLLRSIFRGALKHKYRLIKKGDRVEYALADENEMIQQFTIRKVRHYLSKDALAQTKLFDPEQIGFYEHYYLVDDGKKSVAIPFDWINSIEID